MIEKSPIMPHLSQDKLKEVTMGRNRMRVIRTNQIWRDYQLYINNLLMIFHTIPLTMHRILPLEILPHLILWNQTKRIEWYTEFHLLLLSSLPVQDPFPLSFLLPMFQLQQALPFLPLYLPLTLNPTPLLIHFPREPIQHRPTRENKQRGDIRNICLITPSIILLDLFLLYLLINSINPLPFIPLPSFLTLTLTPYLLPNLNLNQGFPLRKLQNGRRTSFPLWMQTPMKSLMFLPSLPLKNRTTLPLLPPPHLNPLILQALQLLPWPPQLLPPLQWIKAVKMVVYPMEEWVATVRVEWQDMEDLHLPPLHLPPLPRQR